MGRCFRARSGSRHRSRPNDPYRTSARPLQDVAIIVDHSSAGGVVLGIALAAHGFWPVPLYNAIPSPVGLVDLAPIQDALVAGTKQLLRGTKDGPPAFLLDARRERGLPRVGTFDNRSRCSIHDFPSAQHLVDAGIRRALLLCDVIRADVEEVALAWQAAGIGLWHKRPNQRAVAKPIVLSRPWIGRRFWRVLATSRLLANGDGTYGHLFPSAHSG